MRRLNLAEKGVATNQCCAIFPWTEFCNSIGGTPEVMPGVRWPDGPVGLAATQREIGTNARPFEAASVATIRVEKTPERGGRGNSLFQRKRTGITCRSMICERWLPIPRQEIVETVCFVAVDHALEDILEIGERLDVVELCRGDERADSGPSLCSTIGTGEQVVLVPERDGPDGALVTSRSNWAKESSMLRVRRPSGAGSGRPSCRPRPSPRSPRGRDFS